MENKFSLYREHIEQFQKGEIHLTSTSKKKNIKRFLLEKQDRRCSICGMIDEWCEKKIVFVLDHINGNSSDDRPENLRLVCPNCDSQLDTFKSKNGFGRVYDKEYRREKARKYKRDWYHKNKNKNGEVAELV